eukprot:1364929-Rhodomonas_salina.1
MVVETQGVDVVVMDTEMVICGRKGRRLFVAAEVSLVDESGNVLLHTYAKPPMRVVSYNTRYSGVTPRHMRYAPPLREVRSRIESILRGKVLVGHAIENDLRALDLWHPPDAIIDTQKIPEIQLLFANDTPGLKRVCLGLLRREIQSGAHSALEDAQATAAVFSVAR